MSELDVRIVKLEPIRVVAFHAFSASPENDAGKKLVDWAKPRGFLDAPGEHRIFGFDNPSPSPGSPNYGYEFWIVVGSGMKSEDGVNIKEFPGGLYAVTRCEGIEAIGPTWKRLVAWRMGRSKYDCATHQSLEEHVVPFPFSVSGDFTLDLYLPIKE